MIIYDDLKPNKEHQEYFQKNIGIVQRLKGNVRAIDQFRKLYNTLCGSCKAKVIRNPKMKLEEYCGHCQNKVKYRLEKVKELLKCGH